MIVIVGETHDDILYFDSVIANKKKEMLFKRYDISIGTLFSQDVLVAYGLFTSSLSSAIITHILDKYPVDLVFDIGRCISVSENVKNGDVLISKKVIDVNVDLSLLDNVATGQIPGFSRDFVVQDDIIGYVGESMNKRPLVDYHKAVFLSSDNLSEPTRKHLIENRSMFALDSETIAIDQNSAGVAIACSLKDVPYIIVKVAENNVDAGNTLKTYAKVLNRYIDVGKAILATVNDIGRSDILEVD